MFRSLESSVPGLQGATLATFSHLDDVEARIRQLQENLQRSMKEEALEEARQKALQSGSEEVIEDDTLKPPDTPRTKIMKAVYHTDDTVAACRYCGRDIIKEYLAAHEQNCKLVHHLKEAAAQKLDVELLVCEICGQRVQSNRMKAHQASAKCKQRSHEPGAQSSLVVGTTTRVYGGIEEDEDSDDDAEPPQAPQVSSHCECLGVVPRRCVLLLNRNSKSSPWAVTTLSSCGNPLSLMAVQLSLITQYLILKRFQVAQSSALCPRNDPCFAPAIGT